MKKILIGALVGGIVLFVWQYAAWSFLDIHKLEQEPVLANEAAVAAALQGTARGVYWIPGLRQADHKDTESEAHKAWAKKYEAGPIAWISYDPNGKEAMPPKTLAFGAGLCVLIALVVSMMLRGAAIRSYFGRVLFVLGFGLFLAIAMDAQNWLWMNFPLDWTKAWVIDHVAGMGAMGVFLGLIVKPE